MSVAVEDGSVRVRVAPFDGVGGTDADRESERLTVADVELVDVGAGDRLRVMDSVAVDVAVPVGSSVTVDVRVSVTVPVGGGACDGVGVVGRA